MVSGLWLGRTVGVLGPRQLWHQPCKSVAEQGQIFKLLEFRQFRGDRAINLVAAQVHHCKFREVLDRGGETALQVHARQDQSCDVPVGARGTARAWVQAIRAATEPLCSLGRVEQRNPRGALRRREGSGSSAGTRVIQGGCTCHQRPIFLSKGGQPQPQRNQEPAHVALGSRQRSSFDGTKM